MKGEERGGKRRKWEERGGKWRKGEVRGGKGVETETKGRLSVHPPGPAANLCFFSQERPESAGKGSEKR